MQVIVVSFKRVGYGKVMGVSTIIDLISIIILHSPTMLEVEIDIVVLPLKIHNELNYA